MASVQPDTSVELDRRGGVYVLAMKAGENRFNRDFLSELSLALDEVESSKEATALVTVGEGKFYSNGLDLQWMSQQSRDEAMAFVADMLLVFARLLEFPLPTVAAMNGHAFAAGGMMTLAHDYRIMRGDRGYFCLPEIDIEIPLTHGMAALIKQKLGGDLLRDCVLQGLRIGGEEACRRGLVDDAVAEDQVLPTAIDMAAALSGKDRSTYAALKRNIYGETLAVLKGSSAADQN